MGETKIRVLFHNKRIGYRIESKPLIVCYRDRIKDNVLDDFTSWMKSYGIIIDRFEADMHGIFAFTKSEIKEEPAHSDPIYREYIEGEIK